MDLEIDRLKTEWNRDFRMHAEMAMQRSQFRFHPSSFTTSVLLQQMDQEIAALNLRCADYKETVDSMERTRKQMDSQLELARRDPVRVQDLKEREAEVKLKQERYVETVRECEGQAGPDEEGVREAAQGSQGHVRAPRPGTERWDESIHKLGPQPVIGFIDRKLKEQESWLKRKSEPAPPKFARKRGYQPVGNLPPAF